ncbi:hypothetical protein [Thalassovita sp.]|jgi:hypothetical protein|uniref:hypothetical protein n=1 Tax=Thalassovita sp. TaxID=1979401 RepID=UPI003B58DD4F
MRFAVLSIVCLGLLAGCGGKSLTKRQQVTFDGYSFKASLKALKDDPQMFDVTVRRASQSLEAAEDAGRYEATRHCVTRYGNSNLEWLVVRETDDRDVVVNDDILLLRGRCKG